MTCPAPGDSASSSAASSCGKTRSGRSMMARAWRRRSDPHFESVALEPSSLPKLAGFRRFWTLSPKPRRRQRSEVALHHSQQARRGRHLTFTKTAARTFIVHSVTLYSLCPLATRGRIHSLALALNKKHCHTIQSRQVTPSPPRCAASMPLWLQTPRQTRAC